MERKRSLMLNIRNRMLIILGHIMLIDILGNFILTPQIEGMRKTRHNLTSELEELDGVTAFRKNNRQNSL